MRRPRFIARQAAHAKGLLGRLIATIMAGETRQQNLRAIEALNVQPADDVLDVGCGPGAALTELARRSEQGRVVGTDASALMVKIAHERARKAGPADRVEVVVADTRKLPFESGAFDKALCVHVIYFWTDLGPNLKEIARVLKPGGRLALLFRSADDAQAVQSFPSEVYTFRTVEEVRLALAAAGFEVAAASGGAPPHLLIATRLRDRAA